MNFVKLSERAKIYIKAFGLLAVLVVLAVVVLRLATTQIPSQRSKLTLQLQKEQVLEQKTELLRVVESEAQNQAQVLSFALPSQNSSFVAVSQLKFLAAQELIILTNLKIGAETKDGNIASSDISFDAEGALPSVLNFLEGISGVAPIMTIEKIQINQAQGAARANVRLKVFWAELPKTLPKITEPINDLTDEEKEILTHIFELTPPGFVFLEPQAPRENLTPF